MLWASGRPSGSWGPATGGTSRDDPVGSWSLGGPSAEAVTNETGPSEEALERWTRRTHSGRPCDYPAGAECCLSRLPFDLACVQHGWVERSQTGHRLRRTELERGASKSRPLSGVAHPRPDSGRSSGQCLGCCETTGLDHPSQHLEWGRMAWYSHMRISSRRQGHLGPLGRRNPRCLPQ